MKTGFAFCIFVMVFASVQAASLRKSWYDLLPSIQQTKNRVGHVWDNCTSKGGPAKIKSVILTPPTPVKGQNFTVKASIELNKEVTGGKVKLELMFEAIVITNTTFDLCDKVKEYGLECPLSAKTYNFEMIFHIPNGLPEGLYAGNIEATNQDGEELICAVLNIFIQS